MNKILIVFICDIPHFYEWNINVFDSIDDSIDWMLNEIPSVTNFDLIETILDTETYKQLYYENLYNIH